MSRRSILREQCSVLSRSCGSTVQQLRHAKQQYAPPTCLHGGLRQAHARNLSVGLKNDRLQMEELEPWFDWALSTDCYDEEDCGVSFRFVVASLPSTFTPSFCFSKEWWRKHSAAPFFSFLFVLCVTSVALGFVLFVFRLVTSC